MENTGNVVLSRSAFYAALAALAVALLIMVHIAPGPDTWTATQFAQDSTQYSTAGLHSSQLLASAEISAGILRQQLHNTWLFLYVFLIVWLIVTGWSLLERRRLRLEVGRSELGWMGWMSLSVGSMAILYGLGTNGFLARLYPVAVPVSDGLALAFVLALPVFAWRRMQRRGNESLAEVDPQPRPVYTTLGLSAIEPLPLTRESFQETSMQPMISIPEEGLALPNLLTPAPDVRAIAAIDNLMEIAAQTVPRSFDAVDAVGQPQALMLETSPVAPAAPVAAVIPFAPVAMVAAPSPAAASASTAVSVAPLTEDFRENLQAMNAAWGRIEHAGQELEQWFDEQRRQALAHLETHPGARRTQAPAVLSENFLNEKLTAVDSDWAAIRRSALEIARWFGDVPPASRE